MIVMPFDTETSGIPNWKIPSDDPSQPHLVSLAALLVNDETWEEDGVLDLIIKPDGWAWDENCEAFKVHGITVERAMDEGIPEKVALEMLVDFWRQCEMRAAHNTTFDNRMIRIAMKRYCPEFMDEWKNSKYFCTANKSRSIVGLGKVPNLGEAYEFFTGKELEAAHNSMNDCRACLEVYKGILANTDVVKPKYTMGLEDLFVFGKHKGEQLEDVITDDPSYMEWVVGEGMVQFSEEAVSLMTKKGVV